MDSVIWWQDEVEVGPEFSQMQIIVNGLPSTYENTLSNENLADFIGSFTCEVQDVAGNNDMRTLTLNGILHMCWDLLQLLQCFHLHAWCRCRHH